MHKFWSETHSKAFELFIKELESEQIDWLVLRNYNGLPKSNIGKDIDILIKKSKWGRAHKILCRVFKEYGFIYYKVNTFRYIKCYTFFNDNGLTFKLDFFACNEYRGLISHSYKMLINNKVKLTGGIYKPDEAHSALMMWLRPLLGGDYIKEKYIPEINKYFSNNKAEINKELKRLFGKRFGNKVFEYFDEGKIGETINLRSKLKARIFCRQFFKNPVCLIYRNSMHYIHHLISILVKLLIPSGTFSVIGSDGTGKSTFIELFDKAISDYYAVDNSIMSIYHFRPSFLPNLGALGEKAGVMEQDKDFTNPHRAKPAGFFSSLIRMTYYWLDYFIGYRLLVFKNQRHNRFTMFDRYIYDFLIDPERSRINLPYWIRNLYVKMVMQPKLVFVLLTDASIIYERKQELTLEEIECQIVDYMKLAKSGNRFVILDASKTPDEIVNDAIHIYLERFCKRS